MESTTQNRASGFVVCINNEGYELDLVPRKVYEVMPDNTLEPEDIRVIDETGEDYIYPTQYFSSVDDLRGAAVEPSASESGIEREAERFVEEHEPLLAEGSITVLGRVYVQGANIFTVLSEEVVEASRSAVFAKNSLADAIRNPATPARRLQQLEAEEQRASEVYKRRAATSQELSDFLDKVRALLPDHETGDEN